MKMLLYKDVQFRMVRKESHVVPSQEGEKTL